MKLFTISQVLWGPRKNDEASRGFPINPAHKTAVLFYFVFLDVPGRGTCMCAFVLCVCCASGGQNGCEPPCGCREGERPSSARAAGALDHSAACLGPKLEFLREKLKKSIWHFEGHRTSPFKCSSQNRQWNLLRSPVGRTFVNCVLWSSHSRSSKCRCLYLWSPLSEGLRTAFPTDLFTCRTSRSVVCSRQNCLRGFYGWLPRRLGKTLARKWGSQPYRMPWRCSGSLCFHGSSSVALPSSQCSPLNFHM